MTTLREGRVQFVFAEAAQATQYDRWRGYTQRIHSFAESKAVDFLAITPLAQNLYLIEVKDYQLATNAHPPPSRLPLIVAQKCRDTLAGLVLAARSYRAPDRAFARAALEQENLVAILHLDQPRLQFRTRPALLNVADLKIALRQAFKTTSIKVYVASTTDPSGSAPYVASFIA